jgi:hypothetical protein
MNISYDIKFLISLLEACLLKFDQSFLNLALLLASGNLYSFQSLSGEIISVDSAKLFIEEHLSQNILSDESNSAISTIITAKIPNENEIEYKTFMYDKFESENDDLNSTCISNNKSIAQINIKQKKQNSENSQLINMKNIIRRGDTYTTSGAIPPPNYVPKAILFSPPSSSEPPLPPKSHNLVCF